MVKTIAFNGKLKVQFIYHKQENIFTSQKIKKKEEKEIIFILFMCLKFYDQSHFIT